jgi:hypothetical protein
LPLPCGTPDARFGFEALRRWLPPAGEEPAVWKLRLELDAGIVVCGEGGQRSKGAD